MDDVLETLKKSWFTEYQQGRGLGIKNDPDSQARVAFEVRDTCGYTTLQVEASLSRFQQAGGFDAYDERPDGPE